MPLDEIKKAKIDKLNLLKKAGVDPFPAKSWRTHQVFEVLEGFDTFAEEKRRLVVVGRIRALRAHGASTFLDLEDASGRMQVYLKKDVIGEYDYELFSNTVEQGDFLECSGFVFKTKKEEPTLEVEKYRILAKTILPLPEKWHGLQDTEERFRKRYLDMIFNPEVRDNLVMRTKIIQALRDFMNRNDFMEVVTPTLQPLYGGASARPFKTHLHDLDLDLYLRIAPELYLKRLLVGGMERVFEFTTNFRNEGMDREHNPEFSVLEFYAAYRDLEWLMNFTEEIFEHLLLNLFGQAKIKYEDKTIDFTRPFKKEKFNDLLKKHASLDYEMNEEEEFTKTTKELGLKIEKTVGKPGLADELFKKVIRPKLVEPVFVTDWPADILPLAKKLNNGEFVGAFQFFAGGHELIKAFQELNDPLDQRERFKAQEHRRAKGDEEAQRIDEDFLEALEYGMPPAAGWGLGIDRLVALLTNSHSIREIILFPLMKPK